MLPYTAHALRRAAEASWSKGGGEDENFALTGAQQRVALFTLVATVDVVLTRIFRCRCPCSPWSKSKMTLYPRPPAPSRTERAQPLKKGQCLSAPVRGGARPNFKAKNEAPQLAGATSDGFGNRRLFTPCPFLFRFRGRERRGGTKGTLPVLETSRVKRPRIFGPPVFLNESLRLFSSRFPRAHSLSSDRIAPRPERRVRLHGH